MMKKIKGVLLPLNPKMTKPKRTYAIISAEIDHEGGFIPAWVEIKGVEFKKLSGSMMSMK